MSKSNENRNKISIMIENVQSCIVDKAGKVKGEQGKKSSGFKPTPEKLKKDIQLLKKYRLDKKIETDELDKSERDDKKRCEKWNELVEQVEEYCCVWNEKERLQARYDRANGILTAYYARDQILDYIERINQYISELTDDEDVDIAIKACYNNYVYFLIIDVEKMMEKYKIDDCAENAGEAEEEKTSEHEWIREHECSDLESVKWFKARMDTAMGLVIKLNQGKYTEEDTNLYRKLSGIMEEYRHFRKDEDSDFILESIESDIAVMKEKAQQLREQISKMEAEAEKADRLYDAIGAYLTREWTERFKPDESEESSETSADVRERFTQAMAEVNENITEVFKRN